MNLNGWLWVKGRAFHLIENPEQSHLFSPRGSETTVKKSEHFYLQRNSSRYPDKNRSIEINFRKGKKLTKLIHAVSLVRVPAGE